MEPRRLGPSPFDCSVLVTAVERLLGEQDGVADRLCMEVEALTRGRALLRLHPPERARIIRSEVSSDACLYLVEFAGRLYGTLIVVPDSQEPAVPALPDPQARQLARLCGALLCSLEQEALLRALRGHLSPCDPQPLTARQREVLALMARGLSDDAIADELRITPATLRRHRDNLYARLGVHDAHDLLIVAYQDGLISYLTPEAYPPPDSWLAMNERQGILRSA